MTAIKRGLVVAGCLVAALSLYGCDALSVQPFAGSIIELDLTGLAPSPPGKHLEVWARDSFNDVIQVNFLNDAGNRPGFQIVPALFPSAVPNNDPCVIDSHGNLLITPDAYSSTVSYRDEQGQLITQNPQQQADQIINRINQVVAPPQSKSLLAVVPAYDASANPPPISDADPKVPAAQRLADCNAYWKASPLAYTGSPLQVNRPLHGALYGFVSFFTVNPPANISGVELQTPIDLSGIQELWITEEPEGVMPLDRGPIILDGTPDAAGRDAIHFNLRSPLPGVTAEASVLVGFDRDPVQL